MTDPTRVEQIFNEALTRPTSDLRAAYLKEACGDDAQLRQRVDELLAGHEAAGTFLKLPEASSTPLSEGPGSRIGRYKLLQQIGEGGFGVVFMAEQEHPVRRRVALKIIKLGMDTRQVVARFEAERQALAMMEHPNVAKVLDAGATETGRPFFVMELVKGIPITDYCDKHTVSITLRLELFVQVCQAVQHAHQKGLIHRDIKPSNILVNTLDDRPVAKVIDFGIAKATQARLTEKTLFTEFQQLVGTPQYMSPEQAEGSLDVDTRSDVYSLGVLLYELLTGTTPFDPKELRSKAHAEIQRIIREVEPQTPSTRLSTMRDTLPTVAAHRAIEPRKLDALVRGELDWIVMKCLEKDRVRRYETANGLAMDLQRYLADEPVLACPPSTRYRLRKFARRYRVAIAVATAFVGILILGAMVTTWQAVRASRAEAHAKANERRAIQDRDEKEQARREALSSAEAERKARGAEEEQRIRAEEVSNYLVSALSSPAPYRDGRTITIAEVLDRDARELEGKFANDPRTKAAMLEAIGQSYEGLGLFRDAIPLLETVRALRTAALGPNHPDTLLSMHNLAWAYNRAGRLDEAVRFDEETLKLRKATLGPDRPDTLRTMDHLALDYWNVKRLKDALPLLEEAFKLSKVKLGLDHIDTLIVMNDLGEVYRESGRTKEALALAEETVKLMTAKVGAGATAWPMNNLAEVYRSTGRFEEAVTLGEETVKLMKANLGPDHPDTLWSMHALARSYVSAGRLQEGISLMEETLKVMKVKLGPDYRNTFWLTDDLINALQKAGKVPEAVLLTEEKLKLLETKLGPDHLDTKRAANSLAALRTDQSRQSAFERATAALSRARAAAQEQKWDQAVAYCTEQLDSLPHEAGWNTARKLFCREMAAWDEVFDRLVKLRPDDVDLWVGRGRHFAVLHDWKQAIVHYEKVRSDLPHTSEQFEYACLLLLLNDHARYEQYINEIKSQESTVRTAIVIIAPQAVIPGEQFIQWAKNTSMPGGRAPAAFVQAQAYFRAGQFKEAIQSGQKLNNANWAEAARSQNWLVLAMAAQRMGDTAEAQRCMAEARRLIAAAPPIEKYNPTAFPVPDILGSALLLREAEALLAQPASTSAPATRP